MTTRLQCALAVAAVAAAGCTDDFLFGCPSIWKEGLSLHVMDAATGAPVDSARVVARDGAYADTILVRHGFGSGGANRGGTYEVTVDAAGYRPWRRTGVRVPADRCGSPTSLVSVAAALSPAP